MEELTKFLDEIGVKNETIAILKDPPEGGADIKALADEFKATGREVYANDPDVRTKLDQEAKGKARGSVERKIKKVFNISNEEWNEGKLEGDYEKALIFGYKKQEKEGSKSAQELQAELQEANTKIKWYDEEKIPQIQKEADLKVDKNDETRYLRKLIVGSGELTVSERVASTVVAEELKSRGYNTGLTEDKSNLTILTSEGLSPQDEKKTRNLTNDEVIKGILESENLLKVSKADPDTPKPTPLMPKQADLTGSVHPDAIQNLKDVQNMSRKKGSLLA